MEGGYFKDFQLVSKRLVTWAIEASANSVLLTNCGCDLGQLQKALNKMYSGVQKSRREILLWIFPLLL